MIKHGQAPASGNQALLTTESKYNTNNQQTNGTITTQQAHLITIIVILPESLESVKFNVAHQENQ